MNNIIISESTGSRLGRKLICAVMVLGIAFFALANEAFAAPSLTPVTVNGITGTSATIVGHVSNPQKNSTVWFEIFTGGDTGTAVAMQGLWNEGTFEWNLRDLNPGQTYSFRAGATEGASTVYSPITSFTTTAQKVAAPTTTTYQPQPVAVAQPATTVPKVAQAKTVVAPAKQVTTTTVTTKEGFTNGSTNVAPTVINKEGFTNGNSATVIGAGNNLFPVTLIGWLLLILAILVVVLIGRMIYESSENNRRKTYVEVETETE